MLVVNEWISKGNQPARTTSLYYINYAVRFKSIPAGLYSLKRILITVQGFQHVSSSVRAVLAGRRALSVCRKWS